MTTKVLFEVGENDSLAVAAHRMTWLGCRHLPVMREDDLVGVLAERDLLAWKGDGRALDGPGDRVGAAMSTPAIVATPDESLAEASARMIASRIGCLPVVLHGRLVGMLTSTDLLGRHVSMTFEPAAGKDLAAKAVMTATVFTASPRDTLIEAADVMASYRVRHLPVVDDAGRLVGMLSERDLRRALGLPGSSLEQWPAPPSRDRTVAEIMSETVAFVGPEQPLSQMIATMVSRNIGALPVVDDERRPIGIVSYLDVLRAVRRRREGT